MNGVGRPVTRYIFINNEPPGSSRKFFVTGQLIVDEHGEPVAMSKILERKGDLPTKILCNWYEENKILLIELKNPTYNEAIDPHVWEVPNYQPQIDMSEQ